MQGFKSFEESHLRGAGVAGHESGPITPGTSDLITILLTPVAITMVVYALFCFYWRSVFLRKKQACHVLN